MDRRQVIGCLAAGISLAALGRPSWAVSARSFDSLSKSLWVWRTPLAESAAVLDLVGKYRFQRVYYSIPPADRSWLFADSRKEARAIQAFRDAGVAFHAVSGDPGWCRHGDRLPRAVEQILEFQSSSRLLDGLCLDIEPHTLPEWKTGERESIVQGYLDVLSNISLASRTSGFTLTTALIPAYATIPSPCLTGQSVLEEAVDLVDEVVMMAYRNSPETALRVANKSLDQLEASGRPWWFGVSTYRQAREGVSYAGSSFEQFSAAMAEIDSHLGGHGYRGIAVNDYPSVTSILGR